MVELAQLARRLIHYSDEILTSAVCVLNIFLVMQGTFYRERIMKNAVCTLKSAVSEMQAVFLIIVSEFTSVNVERCSVTLPRHRMNILFHRYICCRCLKLVAVGVEPVLNELPQLL